MKAFPGSVSGVERSATGGSSRETSTSGASLAVGLSRDSDSTPPGKTGLVTTVNGGNPQEEVG